MKEAAWRSTSEHPDVGDGSPCIANQTLLGSAGDGSRGTALVGDHGQALLDVAFLPRPAVLPWRRRSKANTGSASSAVLLAGGGS
jgi:hypothetical protein